MPFTANRQFKKAPRLLARAEGMYYWTRRRPPGARRQRRPVVRERRPLPAEDRRGGAAARSARWTSRRPSRWAIRSPSSSPSAWRASRRRASRRVFFTNSGSEVGGHRAQDRARLPPRARRGGSAIRLIGRERGYHGVNFGGMAVGGIPANRKAFGPGVAGVDHIRHTHDLATKRVLARPAASTARNSPTSSSGCARCTIRRPSPR